MDFDDIIVNEEIKDTMSQTKVLMAGSNDVLWIDCKGVTYGVTSEHGIIDEDGILFNNPSADLGWETVEVLVHTYRMQKGERL